MGLKLELGEAIPVPALVGLATPVFALGASRDILRRVDRKVSGDGAESAFARPV